MCCCVQVNALELYTVNPVTKEKIYSVVEGRSISLDVKLELCAGCGVCVGACHVFVITLFGKGEYLAISRSLIPIHKARQTIFLQY